MFADDIALVRMAAEQFGPLPTPIVEVGGLERPTIADYQRTIDAMDVLRDEGQTAWPERIEAAQRARYLQIERPLSFLGEYLIENPETGGVPVELITEKYQGDIGTIVCLSTLEHVADPKLAVYSIWRALRTGGVCIVSVPFQFPHHPSPEDNWRFTPTGLRHLFASAEWETLWCDWRLRIPASAGVLDIHTGQPQAIESCAIIARAK